MDNQQIRENVYLVNTDIDLEKGNVLEDTTEITELQLNNEELENVAIRSTENTNLSTSESVARKMTEITVENVDTEEEIVFDDLTIPGDYSSYDILEEEKETI